MIDSAFHRVTDLGAEPPPPLSAESLARSWRSSPVARPRDLRLDREVPSGGERQTLVAAGIVVSSRLGGCPRLGVARHLQVGECEMVRAPVDAVDDRVGRTFRLVIQAALDQSAED